MLLDYVWSFLKRVVETLLSMLGLGSGLPSLPPPPPHYLRIHVKYAGRTVEVDLDPGWSVGRIKEEIAPLLEVDGNEIKIIFAGNELPDTLVLENCDVGQQSYLHAVRVQVKSQRQNEEAGQNRNLPSSPVPGPSSSSTSSNADVTLMSPTSGVPRTRTFSASVQQEPQQEPGSPVLEEDEGFSIVSHEDVIAATNEAVGANKQSDFFVYCGDTDCGDLREGKLRVRCSLCRSGAFMVHRPPEGWEDVLVKRKITGICEEGCEGPFAQFYFKCTKHVTKGEDDSAPPLSLIKRNREEVPCLACGDVKDPVLVFPCALSHVTCVDCFKDYLMARLNQREFIQDVSVGYTLGCPALCENSLISDPHHFKLLGKYHYDRYQRFATEECLLQLGGVFCPQPDCGMGIIPVDTGCNKIACLHGCGYVFCRLCLEGWHIGQCRTEGQPHEDCSTGGYRSMGYFVSEDRAAAAQWGDPTRRAMRLSTKPCPNCRVPTERAGGCMHMECTKCKFDWCWVCQTKWTRECMGNHWFG